MIEIEINNSGSYSVKIGNGLLDTIGDEIKLFGKVNKVCVVTDTNVNKLYGEQVLDNIRTAGFDVTSFVFPYGEQSKCLNVYGNLVEKLCDDRFTRSDLIVALGGGVVGDLAGFAAATFLRGIRYIQVPTTLLAAVDSSVGGKTAVDLTNGKNQVGCFYQPSLVICDPDTLLTLPDEQYRCGCAEVLKYAILQSHDFYDELLQTPASQQLEHVISTCVEMKKKYVQEDEFDTGSRMFLNLGHSIGHAIENLSGYKTLHGQAVAIGTAAIARSSARHGYCSGKTCDEILAILEKYGLPTENPYSPEEIVNVMLSDKKLINGKLNLIVPEEVGKCRVIKVETEKLIEWV
ncbi:MAG: 3-dehydroquinate synthase [Lachnospiraceae bacterium]|nr:3-dehydroquinate synthase [Lachnospiraceae bacterium]